MRNKNNVKGEVVNMNKKVRTVEQIANSYYKKAIREDNCKINSEEIILLGEYAAVSSRKSNADTITKHLSTALINKTFNQREYTVFWDTYKTFFGEKYEKLVIKLFNYLIENRNDIDCFNIDWLIENYIDGVKEGSFDLALGEIIEEEMSSGCIQLIDMITEADETSDLREAFSEEDVDLCRNIKLNWFNFHYVEHIFRTNNLYAVVIEVIR